MLCENIHSQLLFAHTYENSEFETSKPVIELNRVITFTEMMSRNFSDHYDIPID